jgi:hypothetical protein
MRHKVRVDRRNNCFDLCTQSVTVT